MREGWEWEDFEDTLSHLSVGITPTVIQKISESVENDTAELEGRIRGLSKLSKETTGNDHHPLSSYIEQRAILMDDIQRHLQHVRRVTLRARPSAAEEDEDSKTEDLRRTLEKLGASEDLVLRERAALASSRVRIEYGMRGQLDHTKLGEGYIIALTENFSAPLGSSYPRWKTSGIDQSSFRNRLIKAYQLESSQLLESPGVVGIEKTLWCPISRREHNHRATSAAHIMPCNIGLTNVTYLFGAKAHEGYGILWSERNGLLMYDEIGRDFRRWTYGRHPGPK